MMTVIQLCWDGMRIFTKVNHLIAYDSRFTIKYRWRQKTRAKPEKREWEDLIVLFSWCQESSGSICSIQKLVLLKILKYFNTISEEGAPSEPPYESIADKNIWIDIGKCLLDSRWPLYKGLLNTGSGLGPDNFKNIGNHIYCT